MFKTQIEAILKLDSESREYFKGVFSIDKLPTVCHPKSAYVINYDKSDEPGSHWVAVFRDEAGDIEFFDSFGIPPIDSRCANFIGLNYSYNPYKLQPDLTNSCGFYSTYFVLKRSRKVHSNDILNLLVRSNSDYIVKNFLYNVYKPIFV